MLGMFPYCYEGSLYTPDGVIINEPAILVTKDDIFCKYGNFDFVNKELCRRHDAYISAGFPEEADNLLLISFTSSSDLTVEDITYIIKRMLAYTSTGFITRFVEAFNFPETFKDWLEKEKARIPIDVTKA